MHLPQQHFEAIELRKNGIQGQILILGYTEPSLVYLLKISIDANCY